MLFRSLAATIPKELAERYSLEAGDNLLVVETAEGILLSPYDPDVAEALAIGRRVSKRYRNALRELAK